ncbi:MAG TPA: acetate kinase [Planctomycetes bacterium]|nr:acetate kinase [Planctomycetota bacterium]
MKVLVINCGSSSIKYQLYDMPAGNVLAKGLLERIGEPTSRLLHQARGAAHEIPCAAEDHVAGMETILATLASPDKGVMGAITEIGACGHRVVHGGEEFTGSVIIDGDVIASIERFADLAPLHNPPNLAGIRAARRELPDVPQIACFDTAFHATIPEVAYLYALPYALYEQYRIRRYGFHGTSHRYVARRAAALLGRDKYDINAITCHLGNGCSMAAVRGGRSADTSMGLTPLEGLVMGTRSGDFDPAILMYLAEKGMDTRRLNSLCNKESGLLGISGISNDMRNLAAQARNGERRAALAIDMFCYRVRKYIGAYTAVLGTLDAVVFTGGIGENSPLVREKSCGALAQIGIELDPEKNARPPAREADVAAAASRVRVLVIPTDEEAAIAQDTYALAQDKEQP